MDFSYRNLYQMRNDGAPLGKWKDHRVFAAMKQDLEGLGSGAYYIVFDDDNIIVRCIDGQWYAFGTVNEKGVVSEWNRQKYQLNGRTYCHDTETYEPTHAVCGKTQDECDGTMPLAAEADVKRYMDIDEILKSARTMTVDSLLEGFNYGLE